MKILLTLALILVPCLSLAAGNETNDSYSAAKKMLREIYRDHRVTVYCEAGFDSKNNVILPAGFETASHQKRSAKIEWEHAVPAENFGRAFREWRDGDEQCVHKGRPFRGRRCAEKVNKTFRYMQADMYNLFPSIGSVNATRGARQYSELPAERSAFGTCQAKAAGNRFEPPDGAKGELARAALYMDESYPLYNLSAAQKRLFESWDRDFPVSRWECERCRRIEKLQGNPNRRVKEPCEKAGL